MSAVDHSFRCMGTTVRLILDDRGRRDRSRLPLEDECKLAVAYLREFDARLSRFRPDSELSRLNADPRPAVPASQLLRVLVRAGVWAARRSGGLVDPTLTPDLKRLGYSAPWPHPEAATVAEALAAAPRRAACAPSRERRWESLRANDRRGTVQRTPGVLFDSGGVGKGLAADAVAVRLHALPRFLVDCGGDLVAGGRDDERAPFEVEVEHPLRRQPAHRLTVRDGAVATSGIGRRVWRRTDGSHAHHLLDPSTGEPAWTGLVSATAIAATALEAETVAKMAFLAGPERARTLLLAHGGVLVHDSGEVEVIEPLRLVAGGGERVEPVAA
ncbi:MAG TPA: FAD:protein FMN transferase [Thermoleophilaceae bacterium]